MAKPRVFVTRRLPGTALARLAAETEMHLWEGELPPPREVLLAEAREAEGLLTLLTDRVDRELLAQAPRLRAVSNMAVGYDNIDVAACTERCIAVGNTPGVLTETTADFAFALLMAAARLNIPSVYVGGGPMLTGFYRGEKVDLVRGVFEAVGAYARGALDEDALTEMEASACPTCGSCAGLFTANTMNCLAEALGIALPGNGTIPAPYGQRRALAKLAGQCLMEMVRNNVRPRDILTAAAFRNAIALDMAIGGSTNTVLHLLAVAYEAEVPLTLETFDEISKKVPNICKLSPAGEDRLFDLYLAGGVSAVLKRLSEGGLLSPTEKTVTGKTLGENIERATVRNPQVIRPLSDPYAPEGGIAVLKGNLAPDGAVVKQSAVVREMLVHTGPARVFDGEEEARLAAKAVPVDAAAAVGPHPDFGASGGLHGSDNTRSFFGFFRVCGGLCAIAAGGPREGLGAQAEKAEEKAENPAATLNARTLHLHQGSSCVLGCISVPVRFLHLRPAGGADRPPPTTEFMVAGRGMSRARAFRPVWSQVSSTGGRRRLIAGTARR